MFTNLKIGVSMKKAEGHLKKTEFRCCDIFKPIFFMLLFCGINLYDEDLNQRLTNLKNIFSRCLIIINVVSQVFYCFICVYQLIKEPLPAFFVSFVADTAVFTAQVLIMSLIIHVKRTKMIKLLRDLTEATAKIGTDYFNFTSTRRLFKFIHLSLYFLIAFSFVSCVFLSDDGLDPKRIINTSYIDESTNFEVFVKKLSYVLIGITQISVFTSHVLIVVLFLFLCHTISVNFDYLQKNSNILKRCFVSQHVQDKRILNTISHHKMLCELVCLINITFKEIIAIWSFAEIFTLICTIRALNLQHRYNNIHHQLLMIVMELVVSFCLKTIFSARINQQVSNHVVLRSM